MRGSLPGEMSGWHPEIVESYCRLYLTIWRNVEGQGVQGKWSTVMVAVTRERAHTLKKSKYHGIEIAVLKFLSSPAPLPTPSGPAVSFFLPCQLEGQGPFPGRAPLSPPVVWASSVPLSIPFFILCLLPLRSFLSLVLLFKYTHLSHLGKRSTTGHTFGSINRWSWVGLKFTTLQQALRLGEFSCVCCLSFHVIVLTLTALACIISHQIYRLDTLRRREVRWHTSNQSVRQGSDTCWTAAVLGTDLSASYIWAHLILTTTLKGRWYQSYFYRWWHWDS